MFDTRVSLDKKEMLSFSPPEIAPAGALSHRGLELYDYTQVGSGSVSDNPTNQELTLCPHRLNWRWHMESRGFDNIGTMLTNVRSRK
jgi:hypothetical protein